MAKKDHIAFISHSSKDKVIANQLCRFLENNNISCWIAPRDFSGGKDYLEEVPEAIDKAKIFILIYSEHAPRSPWVSNEIISAADAKKLIIPYRIDDSPLPPGIKFALCNCQWINSSDFPDINDAFNELRKSISEALELPLIESNDTTSKTADQGLKVEPNNSQGLKCDNDTSPSANFDSHEDTADTYRRAAELGDPEAQNSLGDCYFFGRGVKKDRNEAIRWYKKAAAQGLKVEPNNSQGLKCDNDTSPSANFDSHEDTADTYRRAAEQGDPEAQNHDVFISYSSKNIDVANQLCRFLEDNNISCWIAPRNISGGKNYLAEVPKAIRNASIFVLVYSEDASQSSWVMREVTIASNVEKLIIIPLRIDGSPLSDEMEFTLCICQWINSSDFSDINDAFNELRRAILSALPRHQNVTPDTSAPAKDKASSCGADEQEDTAEKYRRATDNKASAPVSKPAQVTVPSYDEVVQDHAKLPLVKELAQNGDPEAQFVLSNCYYGGIGVAENKTEAIKWLQKAAAGGQPRGQWALGEEYFRGSNIPENKAEAVKWFSAAAQQEYANAQYRLGYCYEWGLGISENKAEAIKWYRKAAEQGYAKAQNKLKILDEQHNKASAPVSKPAIVTVPSYDEVRQDHAKLPLLRELAQKGNPEAQFVLGDCYYDGIGVAENKTEAVKWYRKAAEQGNADAQNILGNYYYGGIGVAQDEKEAVKWYRKAAEQGNADAQANLGFCYDNGHGVSQNATEAVKWYRKAAEQGNADAQNQLGLCYALGNGIPENEAEGTKWLCEAAAQGHVSAIKNLLVGFNFPYSEKEKALMEAMRRIAYQRRNCSSFYAGNKNIPENKLLNVVLSYGSTKNSDSIIALYDDTFFGGAEDGFIVTYTGIVGHNAYEKRITDFSWDEITSVHYNERQIRINNSRINVGKNTKSLAQMVLDLRNCFNHFFENYGQYNTAQEILKTMPKERV